MKNIDKNNAENAARSVAASVLGVDEESISVKIYRRKTRITDQAIRDAVKKTGSLRQAARVLGCSAALIHQRVKKFQVVRTTQIIFP